MVKDDLDLSVLIAGCGSIGKRHARVLRGMGVRDLRACDPIAAQRDGLSLETPVRMYCSYEEALAEKPDTVFICAPSKLHLPMANRALEAGAHVFCEKPLSDSTKGIDELAENARRAARKVTVGYCFRHHDGLRKAKDMLESGNLGRIVSIRCMMGEHLPSVRPDYKSMYISQYGGAYELIHGVDLAVWFAKDKVKSVRCIAGVYSDIGIKSPDFAEILVGFENKCIANIHLNFFQIDRRLQLELICTEGIISVEFGRWDKCTVSVCEPGGKWSHEEIATARDDMFRAEDGAFLKAVTSDKPVDCDIAEARKSIEVVERAQLDANLNGSEPVGTGRLS